jgi:putative acetyltransferase
MPAIRAPDPDELDGILAVHRQAFGREDEAQLVRRLQVDGDLRFHRLAEADGTVVAHVAFSPVRIAQGDDGRVLGLAPMAVLPDWQCRGVGSALLRESLDTLRQEGRARAVVVLGDPAYYGRFGFMPASSAGLNDIYGGGDAFMVLALQPDGLAGYRGQVNYAPAFASLAE